MGRRRLPTHLKERRYQTTDGRKRTLYYVELHRQGEHYLIPAGDNLPVATQKRDMILGKLALGCDLAADPDNLRSRKTEKKTGLTFAYWADLWLKVTSHKRSHAKDLVSVGRLKDFFARKALAEITTDQIEDYKRLRSAEKTRYGRPPTPGTINRELSALRSIISLAIQERALSYRLW